MTPIKWERYQGVIPSELIKRRDGREVDWSRGPRSGAGYPAAPTALRASRQAAQSEAPAVSDVKPVLFVGLRTPEHVVKRARNGYA